MAEADLAADYERLTYSLEQLRPVWQAECAQANADKREPDAYLKLQWQAASKAVEDFRVFWRSVDGTVEMGDERYGMVGPDGVGRGRRAGHRVHSANNDGSDVPAADDLEEGSDDGVR